MQSIRHRFIFGSTLVCALLSLTATKVQAVAGLPGVIISDDFNRGTNGTATAGTSPDLVNMPNSTYSTFSYDTTMGIQPTLTGTAANTGFNGQTFLSIASANGYTKPTMLSLSINLELNTIAPDASPSSFNRGIGLGFVSGTMMGGTDSGANFTGLLVNTAGALTLVKNGATIASANPTYSGGFSPNSFYALSYSVDTGTGSITSVTYNNQTFTNFNGAVSAGDFGAANTNLAGFFGSSATYNSTGVVDNFVVAVPEPSTWLGGALLGAAALLGGAKRLRQAFKV